MSNCQVCGKPAGWWGSLRSISRSDCKPFPADLEVNRGEFRSFDNDAQVLEHEEHCLAVVKRCRLVEFPVDPADYRSTPASERARVRPDGLVEKDLGCLFITNRRVSFMGLSESRTIPLNDVLEILRSADTLTITTDTNRVVFVLDSPGRLDAAAAVINKLAELLQNNQEPLIRSEPKAEKK